MCFIKGECEMTTFSAISKAESITDGAMVVRRARQGLLVFAVFLIPFSLFGYWFNVAHNDLPLNLPVLPMMFAPGLASILTRLLRREGFADVSFRRGNMKIANTFLFAYGFPIVVGVVAYGFAFLTGLAKFEPPHFLSRSVRLSRNSRPALHWRGRWVSFYPFSHQPEKRLAGAVTCCLE
jgi:hypothetical protein